MDFNPKNNPVQPRIYYIVIVKLKYQRFF